MNSYFNKVLIIGAIGIFALTGCNNAETTQSSPGESSPSPVSASFGAGYPGVLAVVSATTAAVKAGDYAQGKTEFAKFEDNWKPVEDGIKAKSKDNYNAIEESLDKINGEFKNSNPNQEIILTGLQSIQTTISKTSKL
ncbi:hypothetical protein [Synechocystis sp. PCC 7509]|uniref:hypothetical protein n=1 Tax=Synechocystis sp. PCC 7509 TaxID=927677 RepID=UPI0002ABB50A|nr:hypothetical protein [Synechocystis sp. PCC 7509]